jgi:hypothetical protein
VPVPYTACYKPASEKFSGSLFSTLPVLWGREPDRFTFDHGELITFIKALLIGDLTLKWDVRNDN